MTNTTVMNRARNIMVNTRMEKLIAANVKYNGFTFEEAMLLVFFREIMPTTETETTYTVALDEITRNIPKTIVYTKGNKHFILVVDYNNYKRF